MAGERRGSAFAALLLTSLAIAPAAAQPQPQPATVAACVACHGGPGQPPLAGLPSIAAQPKVFIENQLVLIREGLRDIPAMTALMRGVSDAEIVALAQHFAALPPPPPGAVHQAAKAGQGAELARKLLCGTCHLPTYAGQMQVPRLATQQEDYLLHSMKQFRDKPGPGRDTIMAATLRGLSDAELGQLAHYLATEAAPAKAP